LTPASRASDCQCARKRRIASREAGLAATHEPLADVIFADETAATAKHPGGRAPADQQRSHSGP